MLFYNIGHYAASSGEMPKSKKYSLDTFLLIILDEPTAALDPISESQIYHQFDKIIGNKTAIYISHRLSSCQFCDEIIVFDKGKIIQQGTHQELLLDKGGKYYEMWHAQAQYYL